MRLLSLVLLSLLTACPAPVPTKDSPVTDSEAPTDDSNLTDDSSLTDDSGTTADDSSTTDDSSITDDSSTTIDDSENCDLDGDGICPADGDCNDNDATINPNAQEVCDGIDNNCDRSVDENAQDTFYWDDDGDGYGDPNSSIDACDRPNGYVGNDNDCDDSNADIYPGNIDVAGDGVDQNCDGTDAPVFDIDGDGYSSTVDCDDNDVNVNPGVAEVCNNIDDNCDGSVDNNALDGITYYMDSDGDGYGDSSLTVIACSLLPGYSITDGDCNDADIAYNPIAAESCTDTNDYNCDGITGSIDGDNDGYLACEDCDDSNPSIFPSNPEICDGVDNDCNGLSDDNASGATTLYMDMDGDTFGDPLTAINSCTPLPNYTSDNTDCDDTQSAVAPNLPETCDGLDNNCNGQVDDNAANSTTWYQDSDGDTYGLISVSQRACTQPVGYVSNNTDCNDTAASAYPGGTEYCNSIDDNCDGRVDNSAVDTIAFYLDSDSDGYGSTSIRRSCTQPAGYATTNTDCNDTSASISPGASEYCNSVDDNCNNSIDESSAVDAQTWYQDSDSDGYGNVFVSQRACTQPANYLSDATDCDDSNLNISPVAIEYCNGIDDDCDSTIDDACQ